MRIFVIYISSTPSEYACIVTVYVFNYRFCSPCSTSGYGAGALSGGPGGLDAIPDQPDKQSALLVFHVSSKGNISNVRMISGDTVLLKTFTEVLVKSGPWVPAIVGKKAVASEYTLPIYYHLEYEP